MRIRADIIGNRAFSNDPDEVISMASDYIRWYARGRDEFYRESIFLAMEGLLKTVIKDFQRILDN